MQEYNKLPINNIIFTRNENQTYKCNISKYTKDGKKYIIEMPTLNLEDISISSRIGHESELNLKFVVLDI